MTPRLGIILLAIIVIGMVLLGLRLRPQKAHAFLLMSGTTGSPCTTYVTDFSNSCNLIVAVTAGIAR